MNDLAFARTIEAAQRLSAAGHLYAARFVLRHAARGACLEARHATGATDAVISRIRAKHRAIAGNLWRIYRALPRASAVREFGVSSMVIANPSWPALPAGMHVEVYPLHPAERRGWFARAYAELPDATRTQFGFSRGFMSEERARDFAARAAHVCRVLVELPAEAEVEHDAA